MRRRSLLRVAATSGVGLLAGCTAEEPGSEAPNETATPSETPSPSPTPTTGTVASSSFTVTNVECGAGRNAADGGADGSTVTVTGIVVGSDSCYSAKLDSSAVDDDTLTVRVVSYVPEENQGKACADCVVDVDYEATFEFDGQLPDDVVAYHDGEHVATIPLPE